MNYRVTFVKWGNIVQCLLRNSKIVEGSTKIDGIVNVPKAICFTLRVVSMSSLCMMTSSNGNIFCVAGPLCGEFTGHR